MLLFSKLCCLVSITLIFNVEYFIPNLKLVPFFFTIGGCVTSCPLFLFTIMFDAAVTPEFPSGESMKCYLKSNLTQ